MRVSDTHGPYLYSRMMGMLVKLEPMFAPRNMHFSNYHAWIYCREDNELDEYIIEY